MSKRVLMAIWIGNVNDMGIESPFLGWIVPRALL